MRRPIIYISDILRWADAFYQHWGRWPNRKSGAVEGQIDLTWCGINVALSHGNRGLRGGSSLPRLLAERRGVRNRLSLPRHSVTRILQLADAYHRRTGRWPNTNSGKVIDMPGETWVGLDLALRNGCRGLPGGSSLARLLAERRGVRNPRSLPRLTIRQILQWADAYHRRTGEWPMASSGPIPEAPGETWETIDNALYKGYRGLRHDTLSRLLYRHRGAPHRLLRPRLTIKQILVWADAHYAATGRWPIHISGRVLAAPEESWGAIHSALQNGCRGLPGGSSLYQVLREYRGVDRTARNATRAHAG